MGDAEETRLESDQGVAHDQVLRRLGTQVEHDLPVLRITRRDHGTLVDEYRDMGREALIDAPFENGAEQVGFGRYVCHGSVAPLTRGLGVQRRITFSDGVRASMKPCRLKMRSAYFMRFAAAFGSSMP